MPRNLHDSVGSAALCAAIIRASFVAPPKISQKVLRQLYDVAQCCSIGRPEGDVRAYEWRRIDGRGHVTLRSFAHLHQPPADIRVSPTIPNTIDLYRYHSAEGVIDFRWCLRLSSHNAGGGTRVLRPCEDFWRFVQGDAAGNAATVFHVEVAGIVCRMWGWDLAQSEGSMGLEARLRQRDCSASVPRLKHCRTIRKLAAARSVRLRSCLF